MKSFNKYRFIYEYLPLAAILLTALLVRGLYLWGHPLETRDGLNYIVLTANWFEHGSQALDPYEQTPPLLFCYLSRGLMFCRLSAPIATLSVNITAGILLLIPIWLTGKLFFEDRIAALALTALAAVFPKLVQYSCERLREGLYLFFVAWSLYFWLAVIKGQRRILFTLCCGFAGIFAAACRFEALELLVFCSTTMVIHTLWSTGNMRETLLSVTAFSIGCIGGILFFVLLPGFPNLLVNYLVRFDFL